MDEELREGIHKIKRLRDSMKRRAQVYSSLGSLDDSGTARSLGVLQRSPAPGKKIQKIGFIFLFSPDPFTTFIGPPIILAGKYLDRVYNGATIKDVGVETRNFVTGFSDIKEKIR